LGSGFFGSGFLASAFLGSGFFGSGFSASTFLGSGFFGSGFLGSGLLTSTFFGAGAALSFGSASSLRPSSVLARPWFGSDF
jgi:hypothetical protein